MELWRLDTNTGKLQTVLSLNVFGIIRSIVPFRLTGGSKGKTRDFVYHDLVTQDLISSNLTLQILY